MVCQYYAVLIIVLYIFCDFNYIVRTLFTIWCSRLCRNTKNTSDLSDVTSVYGLCTFQDCDILLRNLRLARLVRELDFARYHFYDQMGIYERSRIQNIRSLQGSTFIVAYTPIPLLSLYKINTKLVYWDERSLFFEHEVVTLRDRKLCCLLVSRQFAIGIDKEPSTEILLSNIPGSQKKPACPTYLKKWLDSQQLTSAKLRNVTI